MRGYPKPYVRKIDQRGNIGIWSVDGEWVRSHLDEEFTNFGQHYRFPFIPENEFWLDREADPGEENYYIDHLLVEYREMKNGASYDEALESADAIERRERGKSQSKTHTIPSDVKLRVLGHVIGKNPATIYQVNGEEVRDQSGDVDWTEGGHGYVYSFIPKNEIWIDDDVELSEIAYIIYHEVYERNLMASGMDYDMAHSSASRSEWFLRHHPNEIGLSLNLVGVELS